MYFKYRKEVSSMFFWTEILRYGWRSTGRSLLTAEVGLLLLVVTPLALLTVLLVNRNLRIEPIRLLGSRED